jgi:hypothetical protein
MKQLDQHPHMCVSVHRSMSMLSTTASHYILNNQLPGGERKYVCIKKPQIVINAKMKAQTMRTNLISADV